MVVTLISKVESLEKTIKEHEKAIAYLTEEIDMVIKAGMSTIEALKLQQKTINTLVNAVKRLVTHEKLPTINENLH